MATPYPTVEAGGYAGDEFALYPQALPESQKYRFCSRIAREKMFGR